MFHKQYIVLVCLALIAVVASQGVRMFGNKKHPTLADHCYDDDTKSSIKVNEFVSPTNIEWKCVKLFCRDDFVLQVENCQRNAPTCGKPDFSKPFPECCSAC